MFGYVYLTTNLVNGKMYIGQHICEEYDTKYYGSGKILVMAIKKYGLKNFKNEILYKANNADELNEKEKYFIELYRKKYKSLMYNIANGGTGGDTFSSKTEEEKEAFKEKMTKINRERCATPEFKEKISKASTKRYADINERQKQSERVKIAWSNPVLLKAHSEHLKNYYKTHTKDNSYNNKPCGFELNGVVKEFKNIKELKIFLKETYHYSPSNPVLKHVLIDGTNGIPYKPFFRNKYAEINGMLIYYKNKQN